MKTFKINQIKNKRILGRNVEGAEESDKPLALFWGAAALEFNVKAKHVYVEFSSEYDSSEPWVAVLVNGFQVSRFMVCKGQTHNICVAANLNPEKENLISIVKDTQPMTGEAHHSLFIHSVSLDDDGDFCPVVPRKLKMEFIGDSITSGEGLAGGVNEMEWIPQWFCASKTYAMQTAFALNADWSVISQCGWGLCWGWDGNVNSIIPPHYEDVCSVMWGDYQNSLGVNQKYNFENGSDIVVINLGTNDNGAFFQQPWKDENGVEHVLNRDENDVACVEDGTKVYQGAIEFLKKIRRHNPKAKIIWVWGMIKLVAIPCYIKKAVEDYKKQTGDACVYALELDSMENVEVLPEDKGSRGHPGPKTHYLAAKKITEFVKNLL